MWGKRGRDRDAERRHREAMDVSQRGVRLSGWNLVLAALAVLVSTIGVYWQLRGGDDPGQQRGSATQPTPRPAATVELDQTPENAVFALPSDELPTPPDYVPDGPDAQESHCAEWAEWLNDQPAAQSSDPRIMVSAPAAAAATITAVRTRIFKATRPKATFVRCHEGAGGYEPTYLQIDLDAPDRRPVLTKEMEGDEIGPLPDAVFTVGPGRTEYLALIATGKANWFYEWAVEVDVMVDGRRRTVELGSERRPLRTWSGSHGLERVDYDPAAQAWVPVGG